MARLFSDLLVASQTHRCTENRHLAVQCSKFGLEAKVRSRPIRRNGGETRYGTDVASHHSPTPPIAVGEMASTARLSPASRTLVRHDIDGSMATRPGCTSTACRLVRKQTPKYKIQETK